MFLLIRIGTDRSWWRFFIVYWINFWFWFYYWWRLLWRFYIIIVIIIWLFKNGKFSGWKFFWFRKWLSCTYKKGEILYLYLYIKPIIRKIIIPELLTGSSESFLWIEGVLFSFKPLMLLFRCGGFGGNFDCFYKEITWINYDQIWFVK